MKPLRGGPRFIGSSEGKNDGDGNLVLKLRYRIEPEGMAPIEGKTSATRNDLKGRAAGARHAAAGAVDSAEEATGVVADASGLRR